MNISKSMFKNLTRCYNFASLYDMYIYRNAHHIESINGEDITQTKKNVLDLKEGIFSEENEAAKEIFSHMFDDENGSDLTEICNSQLEAFAQYFNKIEILAGNIIEKKFPGKIIYDLDVKKQKKFEFTQDNHNYYCYLDIYAEGNDGIIRIFEVKATTIKKFYKLGKKICESEINQRIPCCKQYDSIFIKGNDDIIKLKEEFVKSDDLDQKYYDYRNKLFNRYGADGTGQYVYDLAIERYILENSERQKRNVEEAVLNKYKYYLVVLNCDYLFDGTYCDEEPVYHPDKDQNDIISIIDLTRITKEMQERISEEAKLIASRIDSKEINKYKVGKWCELKKSTQCKFQPVCYSKTICDGSILEYMHKTYAFTGPAIPKDEKLNVYDLINLGNYKLDDIPRDYLGKRSNLIQYDCYTQNTTFVDKDKILAVLNTLSYPLYHLDFETYACPLPRYEGETPYMQSVFQFSLHIEKERGKCDKENDHYEYLAPDHKDHRRELCEAMINYIDLSKGGTVIVYNESFEKTRLKELALIFPDLAEPLLKIRDAIFDLLYVLQGNKKLFMDLLPKDLSKKECEKKAAEINYYHNNMHGSYSIKKILPLFTNLSYKDLTVHNGTDAVLVYGLLPTFTQTEYEKYYLALRKYCQQDTWAMVEILWGLLKI